MNILLICKGEYRYFFPAIARELREGHGCDVSAVAFTSPAFRMLDASGAFNEVFNLAAWLKSFISGFNLETSIESLREFEDQHECQGMNMMLSADRIISTYSFERGIRTLEGIRRFWEHILDRAPMDAILGEISCATEWIAWCVARRRNISYLLPYPAPVANHFFFLDGPAGLWHSMRERFETVKTRTLSHEAANRATQFVHRFRRQKIKAPFLGWAQHSPLVPRLRDLARRGARIPFRVQTFLEDGKFEVGSYHGSPPWQPVWQDTVRISRHVVSEAAIFDRRIASGPKIYFPLHVQPEFTTDVRAPFCTNQMAIIENIGKSLPIGYRLMVKEHPGMKGERKLSYYRAIKKLPNVRLLSPSVDSHDLIQQSDAVVTITGSSAWESILYEKPVVALGSLCYGFCGLVYHCQSIAELPGLLSKALYDFRPNRDLLLKFVWSFLESAYYLEWGDPVRNPAALARANIQKIGAAIVSEIASRCPSRAPVFVAI